MLTGAVLILMGPVVGTLVFFGNRDLDHREVLVPMLSLSLLMGWLALMTLFYIMVKAKKDKARSEELVERLSNRLLL